MANDVSEQRPTLSAFDFTLLVISGVIGADVYVVSGLGARLMGPGQLIVWLVAGVMSALIVVAFVQCAAIYPHVGGSYAYARAAFGPFAGFVTGWVLFLGEWIALPVFPLAFTTYLAYFVPLHGWLARLLVKAALIAVITGVNLVGARSSGRLNDVLTVAKIAPLALLVVLAAVFIVARPGTAHAHLTPFLPLGLGGFGSATLLIFWAYAGFEIAVLPAGEVKSPGRTLPLGLVIGMSIATAFYMLTAIAVTVALPWQSAAASPRPLADALNAVLTALGLPGDWGAAVMAAGALVSIAGVYTVFTLSVARLSYAMASDGLFPPPFARLHHRFGTPWVGLLLQAVWALLGASVLDLSGLIAGSVVFLGLCYVMTAAAAIKLVRMSPERALHIPGLRVVLVLAAGSGVYLTAQGPRASLPVYAAAFALGLLIYLVRQRSWRGAAALGGDLRREEARFARWSRAEERWLLRFVRRQR